MNFTESHEWIKSNESDIGAVGITHYAQKELGDTVYVELPKVGALIKKGDQAAVLESTKAAADIYTPVSGTIVEVNERLKEFPELINKSPENEGWIFKIHILNPQELEELMNEVTYQQMTFQT